MLIDGVRLGVLVGALVAAAAACSREHAPFASGTTSGNEDEDDGGSAATGGSSTSKPKPRGGSGGMAGTSSAGRGGSTSSAGTDGNAGASDEAGAASGGDGSGPPRGEPCVAPYPNGFCFVSEPDDFIGEGRSGVISGDVGQVLVKGPYWLIFAAAQTGVGEFYGELDADYGHYLLPGLHSPADEHALPGAARMYVTGNGHACEPTGAFTIHEIGRDPYGNYNRLSATLVQHCEYSTAKLYSVVHVNATGKDDPLPADPDDCEVSSPLGLCYVSQAGHWVGRGGAVNVHGDNATFGVAASYDGPVIAVSKLNYSPIWQSYFGGPDHARLTVGHYDNASNDIPGAPIMSACEGLQGSFDVLAAEYSGPIDGPRSETDILRLDVDFRYTCAGSPNSWLHGKLRYTKPQ
jgi:hypothetical protein